MKFSKTSNLYFLNKSTYINLRWIAYIGQLITILTVQFLLNFKFNYILCIFIVFLSLLTNFYLKFKIKKNQLNNLSSTIYLAFDIIQLGILYLKSPIFFIMMNMERRKVTVLLQKGELKE